MCVSVDYHIFSKILKSDTITRIPDPYWFSWRLCFHHWKCQKASFTKWEPIKRNAVWLILKSWATQPSSLHCVWQLSTITVFLETFMYLRVSPWVHLVLQESLAHRLGIVAILYSKVTKIKFSEKCYFHHTLFFLMFKAFFSRCFHYNCCPVSLFLLCLIKDNFVHWLGEADTNYGRKQ